MHRHLPEASPRWPQGQGRVAFLPYVSVRLKCLKPKDPEIEPKTLGEHLKRRRLERQLTQKQLARLLGVDGWTVLKWEKGHSQPSVRAMPAILQFLSYDPFPKPRGLTECLLRKRKLMGWPIREAAQHAGVDATSWGDWERGKTVLFRRHRKLLAQMLGLSITEVDAEMRARWNQSHKSARPKA